MNNGLLSKFTRALFALAALASVGVAQARNDKLLLPIDVALRSPGTRQLLGQDVVLRFGKASAAGAEILNPSIQVHAVADPFGGRRERRSDEQICLDAFRKAVVDLQQHARSTGAGAVVGIVSDYNRIEFDSPQVYECHVGMTRAVVDLKGQSAKSAGPAMTHPASVTPAIPLIASGFANISDIDAIPYLSDKGREGYRVYLSRPTPKAFALSTAGNWFSAWTLTPADASMPTDPAERAVLACNRTSPAPCALYAVNGAVVWKGAPPPIDQQGKK